MRSTLRVIFAAAVAILLPGCGKRPPPAPPPDHQNQPRIAVLSPALGVVLADVGLGERIVGRHGYDRVLDPSIPVCGEQSGVNYEALIRVNPTHVITEWGTREFPARLTTLAESNGWIVRDFRMLTLNDIDSAATSLAELLPGAELSPRVRRMHEIATTVHPETIWAGRVLLLMDASPIAALGPGSAHQELLVRVGGVPAITEGSPYMPMHKEDLARIAPDAIILVQPRAGGDDAPPATAESVREQLHAITSLDIPAAQSGRIAIVDHPLALLPSTALADVADEFAALLARWAEE
jgi:ABC-type hemin transport system substrate-binding protein